MDVGDGEDEDEEGDPPPGVKKHLSLKKTLRSKEYKGVHRWPPPEFDMEEDDEEDPDDIPGCEYCVDKPCNPRLAWRAFYKQGFNRRDSFCIGRSCEDPAWDEEDEDDEEETGDVEKNKSGESKNLGKSENVDKDPNQNSEQSESPLPSANTHLLSSSCLSSDWGSQLPDPVHHHWVPDQLLHCQLLWRPWEIEDKMLPNARLEERQVERSTDAGMDLSRNSKECPLLPAAELPPVLHLTPSKAAFSPFYPSPPRGRLLRREGKKKRSQGDLLRRRRRLITYQLEHTPPSTPSKPEPDQSQLESGCLGGYSGSSFLFSSTLPSPWSQPLWSSPGWGTALGPSPPPTSGWRTSPPGPSPPPPPTWLPSNMAPPSSPAFCDGCQRWGNLLSVTVSQTRSH